MECLSYCIAHRIDLAGVDHDFKTQPHIYLSTRTRDVIRLNLLKDSSRLVFIFKNGTLVCWGMKRHEIPALLESIKPYCDKILPIIVHDEFSYRVTEDEKISIQPHDYFEVDCLSISKSLDCDEIRLSLSYGFSQSVKLQSFENRIDTLTEKYTPLIAKVSELKKMPISRNKVRQAVAEIIETKTDINLISNFLYHPKFFWQHPTLEEYFIMLERYLHIQRRVTAINHRLDTIDEIFHMFNRFLEDKHAHNLEIIIIILIMIEIIFGVIGFHY